MTDMTDTNDTTPGIATLDAGTLPWEPLAPRAWFKLLRTAPDGGWTSLIRLEPGGKVPMHRHEASAQGLVVEGEGAYAGTEHRVRAGSFVAEAHGTVDEFVNTGTTDLVVLFVVQGPVRFLAQADRPEVLSTSHDKVQRWPHAYVSDTQVVQGGAHATV